MTDEKKETGEGKEALPQRDLFLGLI